MANTELDVSTWSSAVALPERMALRVARLLNHVEAATAGGRLGATWGGLAYAGDRPVVLAEKEQRRAIRVTPPDEEVAAPQVGAADDVRLVPLRAEANVDRERHEAPAARVEERGLMEHLHATLVWARASAREARALEVGQRLHEPVFDPTPDPLGDGRLIGRDDRRGERESERAEREPAERFHDGSFPRARGLDRRKAGRGPGVAK